MNYDFTDLEAFLAVKETGSFQIAATRLNLSQSAITRRIKKLEDALDTRLFVRTTRHVKPTLAAKRLQARAEAMLESARETTRAMRDESAAFAHQRNAIVSVAILPTVASMLLPATLRIFHDNGHRARLRILDRAANEVAEAVAQGDADFGVCSIPALEPSTHFDPLFEDEIVLALPRDHRLAQKSSVSWSDLAGQALILPGPGTGNRLLIDEALARVAVPVEWAFEVGRSTTALHLVETGSGIALLPRSSVASLGDDHVVMRPIGDPAIARPIGIISRLGQNDHPAATALKSAFRRAVAMSRLRG